MSLESVLNSLPDFKSDEILKSFVKGYSIINNPIYKKPVCSISGGSDSDIMLDIIHRIDEQKKVTYVWFDTGLEYKATKEHLKYLENRYGIEIRRESAVKPIPVCTREYGQPFLSKFVSEAIGNLQKYNFTFTDEPLNILIEKYPKSKGYIKWWCNAHEVKDGYTTTMFNIGYNKWLKEFLIESPPHFKISKLCCKYAKKMVSQRVIDNCDYDLSITGLRKSEGGVRSRAFISCYSTNSDKVDSYRPLFWFKDADKDIYRSAFDIVYSECYTKWGFLRTGCCGCPYDPKCIQHNNIVKQFEPNMYKAVNNVFKESYEYTKQYRQFVREMKDKERGRKTLF